MGFKPPEIPPPTNSLVTPMLTDMYQITMVYAYWKAGKHDEFAVFDLFFRKNPFGGEFCIFAGLDEVLKFVQHFRFTDEDVEYLRSVHTTFCWREFCWVCTCIVIGWDNGLERGTGRSCPTAKAHSSST